MIPSSVVDPDPLGSAFIWLSWTRIRIGNVIRNWIQEQGNWPKFTNKLGFLLFKKLLYLRRYVFFTFYLL
jgi:hypothetical protein